MYYFKHFFFVVVVVVAVVVVVVVREKVPFFIFIFNTKSFSKTCVKRPLKLGLSDNW